MKATQAGLNLDLMDAFGKRRPVLERRVHLAEEEIRRPVRKAKKPPPAAHDAGKNKGKGLRSGLYRTRAKPA